MDLNKKFEKAYKKMDLKKQKDQTDQEVIVNIPTDNGKDCYYLVKILKKV